MQGTAATIERAFGVQLRDYRTNDGTFYSNDSEPKLPGSISPYVHSIDGLNDIQQMRTMADAVQPASPRFVAGPAVAPGPTIQRNATAKAPAPQPDLTNGFYDPQDIYSPGVYDYAALQRQGHCCNPTHVSTGSPAQTSIAIATFGTQASSDFTGFHNAFPYLAQNITEYYIDGTPTTSDFEGTMDAEWSLATSNSFGSYLDTAHVYLYDGANTNNATYTDIYNQMLNDNRARVFSTSWSCTEWTGCTSDTMETRSGIFSSMAAQGWTLVTASGDRGAYDDCHDVMVSYPASDPNVLGVGGTWLQLNASDQWLAETAWQANPQGCANNGGGSGGGCSFQFDRPSYDNQQLCGVARSVPDVSLNADWYNEPQNYYYNGALRLNGGTSIAAPEMAGFFAEENAYRASFGSGPLGVANYPVWDAAQYTGTHRPFYDITVGCNGNDIGQGYCAGPGYDLVTGWGSADMLMLAWDINYFSTPDDGRPVVSLSGPPTSTWIRTNTPITWTVADTGGGAAATGVAGYSSAWDQTIADPYSEAHGGSGNVFFDGPQVPNGTSGSAYPSSAGQGCNTLHVDAWDNMGFSSTDQTYGPVCYDSVAPTITVVPKSLMTVGAKVTATGVPVTTSWAATDTTSGVKSYTLQRKTDAGAFTNVTLSSPTATSITQTLAPGHTYTYQVQATDNAGNTSAVRALRRLQGEPGAGKRCRRRLLGRLDAPGTERCVGRVRRLLVGERQDGDDLGEGQGVRLGVDRGNEPRRRIGQVRCDRAGECRHEGHGHEPGDDRVRQGVHVRAAQVRDHEQRHRRTPARRRRRVRLLQLTVGDAAAYTSSSSVTGPSLTRLTWTRRWSSRPESRPRAPSTWAR